jgi:Tol biopolymer transport system component
VFSVAAESGLPDGVAAVYRDTSGLWTIEGRSGPRPLYSGAVSDWRVAPDRSAVAVLVPGDDGVSLDVVDWLTGESIASVSPANLQAMDGDPDEPREVAAAEWLPDSSALVFGSGVPSEVFAAVADDYQVLDVADGAASVLLAAGDGGVPLPSPDGSWVALTRPARDDDNAVIAVARPDGTERRELLAHPAIRTDERLADVRLPAWSADSSALLLVLPGQDDSGRPWMGSERSEIIRIPVDGTEPQRVEIPLRGHASGRGVAWSPDGSAIAYTRPSSASGPDGEPSAPTEPSASTEPTESSGGASSSQGGTEGSQDLVVASWDGRAEVVYARYPAMRFLAWAGDSEHFLYESNDRLFLGRRGEAPVSFGTLSDSSVWSAAVIDPRHIVLLGQELVVRTPDGDESLLATDVGRFEVLLP